jgi:hypothetical protein
MQNSIHYRMIPISVEFIRTLWFWSWIFAFPAFLAVIPFRNLPPTIVYATNCSVRCTIQFSIEWYPFQLNSSRTLWFWSRIFAFQAFFAVIPFRTLPPTSVYATNCCVGCRIQFSIEWCPLQLNSSRTLWFWSWMLAFPAFFAVIPFRNLPPTSVYATNCCVRCRIQFSIEWYPFQLNSSRTRWFGSWMLAFPAFFAVIPFRNLPPTSVYATNCCVRCRIQFSIEWYPLQLNSSRTLWFW